MEGARTGYLSRRAPNTVCSDMFSIYIHYPFCASKCAYCDFVSRPGASHEERAAYVDLVMTEIAGAAERAPISSRHAADTLFFGGGTPSLMEPREIGRIIKEIDLRFGIRQGAEISMESNPAARNADVWLNGAREAGVNRLVVGVQSLDDKELAFLGRAHNARQASSFFAKARAADFHSVGIDLIYGLPGQRARDWEITLEQALDMNPDHVSLYCLEAPPGTRLAADIEAGKIKPLDGDAQADMYFAAARALESSGRACYEISNFSLPGHECRHNLVYWLGGDYLGVGISACSYIDGERFDNERDFSRYKEKVERGERPARCSERLSYPRRIRESAAMALRTSAGFVSPDIHSFHGRALEADLAALERDGFIETKPSGARALLPDKRFVSDTAFSRLI
ncbi:MAG: Oxygen-independent coproporphyrinogen-III oxidase 1 [bacterium ADurb.Bin236]|nr:MAG: Oxygen-independent coproporphyrinogen-III oxidase 1 [bacterium ADurb.Bin236]